MIQPTIGRVVWYQPGHAPGLPDLPQPHPALVCHVHSSTMVNLGGFDSSGKPFSATSVTLLQDEDPIVPAHGNYAQWMPYQKGQAAKTEALEAKAEG